MTHHLTDVDLFDALAGVDGDEWLTDAALRAPVEAARAAWPVFVAWLQSAELEPADWTPRAPILGNPDDDDAEMADPIIDGGELTFAVAGDGEIVLVDGPEELIRAAMVAGFRHATVKADSSEIKVDGAATANEDGTIDVSRSFTVGAFVFWCARGVAAIAPEDAKAIAHRFDGLDADLIVPAYSGDRATFGRAVQRAAAGLARAGFLLRPLDVKAQDHATYSIIAEHKNLESLRIDHGFRANVSWTAEPDPRTVHGDHPVAGRVRAIFDTLAGKVVADDWSANLSKYLVGELQGVSMRDDGRVYWLPPASIEDVTTLKGFLHEVGIDLVLAPITEESHHVVKAAATSSIAAELDKLTAEVEGFDGTEKPSLYERRLEKYAELRDRAVLYRDSLGVGVAQAEEALEALETKVGEMLMLRTQTVVHREEKIEAVAAPLVKRPTLVFGALRFEQSVSDATRFVSPTRDGIGGEMLLSTFGLDTPVGPSELRAEQDGAGIVLVLTGTATLAELVPSLRSFGIEVAPA